MPLSSGFRFAQSMAGRLTVRSAMNPLLWMSAVLVLPAFLLAVYVRADRPLMWVFLGMGAIGFLITFGIALWFAVTQPNLLQSEGHQTRQVALQMLDRQRLRSGEVIDGIVSIATTNPVAERLALAEPVAEDADPREERI